MIVSLLNETMLMNKIKFDRKSCDFLIRPGTYELNYELRFRAANCIWRLKCFLRVIGVAAGLKQDNEIYIANQCLF